MIKQSFLCLFFCIMGLTRGEKATYSIALVFITFQPLFAVSLGLATLFMLFLWLER